MASHTYYSRLGENIPEAVGLHLKLDIGATGAILSTSKYARVSAVTRNGTGDYTLTLSEAYPSGALRSAHFTYNVNSTTATDLTFQLYSVDELNKSIKFKSLTGVTATEMGSGSTLLIGLTMRNTNL